MSLIKYIFGLFLLIIPVGVLNCQELNMKITVDASRIQSTDNALFEGLQENLNQFVNGNRWTNDTYGANELIDCVITIVLTAKTGENNYNAEVQVSATRPVFNSTYTSPIFRFADNKVDFTYQMGESLRYSDNNVANNLVAVISFYVYLILGMDADSFELNGGKNYFDKAASIADAALNLTTLGWETHGEDRNRYALVKSLTEPRNANFHSIWYDYHRKGLDDMVANATRGRNAITKSISDLQNLYQAESLSFAITLFGDIKLNEVVSVYSGALPDEKQDVMKTLLNVYPTKRSIIDQMKN